MSKKHDGGSAFPVARNYGSDVSGMTLRDYFAGQTLRGSALLTVVLAEGIAHDAYLIADAMLAEREKGE
jgi:hypothetical protein